MDSSKILTFEVDLEIYPLPAIFSTAYAFTEKAYLLLDKEDNNIKINMWQLESSKDDLEATKKEFLNELLNQSFLLENSEEITSFKEKIAPKQEKGPETKESNIIEDIFSDDELEFEDPEDIAIPWEEKYGNKEGKNGPDENNKC